MFLSARKGIFCIYLLGFITWRESLPIKHIPSLKNLTGYTTMIE